LDFFLGLPEADRSKVKVDVRGSQLSSRCFEFSGACAGCGKPNTSSYSRSSSATAC